MDGFRSASMFCVVDFVGGKKRAVVPDTWLSVNETHCLLPPKVSDSDLDVLVRNLAEPGQGWQLLEVSSLETFGSYYEAKKKLEKSEETSEASSQRKRKKPSYLEDYSTLDSDDGRKPFTVFGVDFDEEAMSENEWIPPPEFSPRIENVSTVNKTILNDTRPRNSQISQSRLSSQKENIDITCDCQSTCHSTFLRGLHSMQKQLDRTNQMVQQLLGGQKQTHTELKRVLQSQPVNQINGQQEMDVFSQGITNFAQRELREKAVSSNDPFLDSLVTPVKSGIMKRRKKSASSTYHDFPLPEFSNALKPLLRGEILPVKDHDKLLSMLKEEIIAFLNQKNLISSGNNATLRWEYRRLGKTLAEKYPKMLWDLPSDKQRKMRTPNAPVYAVFLRRLSQRRKMQRLRLKAKIGEYVNPVEKENVGTEDTLPEKNPSTSGTQMRTENLVSFSEVEDKYVSGDRPSSAEKYGDDIEELIDSENDESALGNKNKIQVVLKQEKVSTSSEQYLDSLMLSDEESFAEETFDDIFPSFSRQWPDHIEIQTEHFSRELQEDLNAERDLSWDSKKELVEYLANYAYSFKPYPNKADRIEICEALVKRYPYLRKTFGQGIEGWEVKLMNKLKRLRQKDNSEVVRLKRVKSKVPGSKVPKRVRVASQIRELNWAPDHLPGETEESVLCHKRMLLEESLKPLKDQDANKVSALMYLTYSFRREKINDKISLRELKEEYPALFQMNEQFNEFHRMASVNIHETFLREASKQGPCLYYIFQNRKKSEHESNLLRKFHTDQNRLGVEKQFQAKAAFGIFILPYLLKEDIDSIFKRMAKSERVSDYESSYPKIFFFDKFVNSTYIIMCENVELNRTNNFMDAVCLLMSFYYTLAIDYAPPVINTLTFLQNVILKIKSKTIIPGRAKILMNKL